jgi:hypothetical protein
MLITDVTQFATALAMANGHPDPAGFAQTVANNFTALATQAAPTPTPAIAAPESENGTQYEWVPVNH